VNDFRLTRDERLSGRKRIEYLYAKGKSFSQVPFRITWIIHEEAGEKFPVRVLFSAPKKKFKKAVTRNRLKRLMREAYRKNKHILYQGLISEKKQIRLSLVFTGDAGIGYAETESKIILTLQRLLTEIKQHSS